MYSFNDWHDLKGYPGYKINPYGEIANEASGYLVGAGPNTRGYYRVSIFDETGTRQTVYVARLVAETFMEGYSGQRLRHIDGDPSNNAIWNLEYRDDVES